MSAGVMWLPAEARRKRAARQLEECLVLYH
jgi:hypothetical protein